jgi:hypothetical protein
LVPSERVIDPRVAETPVPAVGEAGAGTGGQYCRHVPLQFEWPCESFANVYTVAPLLSTRTVPRLVVAVFRVTPLAAAVFELLGALDGLPEPVDPGEELAHADTTSATAAIPVPTADHLTSPGRRPRLGPAVRARASLLADILPPPLTYRSRTADPCGSAGPGMRSAGCIGFRRFRRIAHVGEGV